MTNSVNQITGSYLSSKLGTREDMARYAQGWDRIFGAKEIVAGPQSTLYDRYYLQMEAEYLDRLEEEAEKRYDNLKMDTLKSDALKSDTNKEE